MRLTGFNATVLALGAILLVIGVESGRGQTVTLITTNTAWRYNQTGTNLGTAWIAPDYDGTAPGWEGPGLPLFGHENSPTEYYDAYGLLFNTDFGDPQAPGNFRTNYYFRTHFNMQLSGWDPDQRHAMDHQLDR